MSGRTIPPVEEVAAGAWSLPLPIPDNPLAYVGAYALEVEGGLALIDAGWNAEATYTALVDGLAEVGAAVDDVRAVLVTHIHPDHYGLAGRIREESGAWVALHPADDALIHDRYEDVDDLLERMEAWLLDAGAPEDAIRELRDSSLSIRRFVVSARPDRLLEHGDRVDLPGWDLLAIHTPGHTPGHLCFHAERAGLVFTGDHVLPRITPHVGSNPQSTDDPLGDFLASMDRVRGLGDDPLALPGHEYRFRGLDRRIDDLVAHHDDRLAEVGGLVAGGADTTWEVASRTTWSRGWDRLHGYMRRMALAEVEAHLIHLERLGRLRTVDGRPTRWRPPGDG